MASLALAPLTAIAGPVVAYNVLALVSLPLAAWAGFLLCRHVVANYSAASLGGAVFGFSPFMTEQFRTADLSQILTFPLPMMVLIVLLYWNGKIGKFLAIIAFIVVITAQFLLSVENVATAAFFGAMVLGLAYVLHIPDRQRVFMLIESVAWAAACATVLLAPYLYYLFRSATAGTTMSPAFYSVNLANLFFPAPPLELGRWISANRLLGLPTPNPDARTISFGVLLAMPVALYAARHWNDPRARLLLMSLIGVGVFALGPRLRVGNWVGPGLPWKVFEHVPNAA